MKESSSAAAPEVAVYRHQAEIIHGRVRRNLEDFSHEDSLVQPKPAGHSANWVLGHLVEIYERALSNLGQEAVLPEGTLNRYRQGVGIHEDPAEAIEVAELLKAWDVANERFDDGLRNLTADALHVSGRYYRSRTEPTTLRRYLDMILFHQAYHSGQLGLLRRLVGKEGAVP